MLNIFIAFILVLLTPFYVSADSFIQWNFSGFDKDVFFHGVGMIQKITLGICLITGPWQFVPALFRKYPTLHFALGNVYVMVSLLLASLTTIVMAFAQQRLLEIFYLVFIGIVWWWSTRRGIYYISNKKWLLHLEWMSLSFLSVCSVAIYMLIPKVELSMFFCVIVTSLFLLLRQRKMYQRLLSAFFKK